MWKMGLTDHHWFFLAVWRNWEWAEWEQCRILVFKQILKIFFMVISLRPVLKGFSRNNVVTVFSSFPVLIPNFLKREKEKERTEDRPALLTWLERQPKGDQRSHQVDVGTLRPKEPGRWNAHTRSLVQLWCGVGLELVRLSALDPLSGQEKWRRLAGGRFGFIALYL